MGYTVKVGGAQGDANSIVVDDAGVAWGANDRRDADGKASIAAAAAATAAAQKGTRSK